MFNTYTEYRDSVASEKILLVHLEATTRLYNFVVDGTHYSRVTPYFVNKVSNGYNQLTRVDTIDELIDNTRFFFDVTNMKLFLFEFDTLVDEIIVSYRLFLSSAPINLPWNLSDSSSHEVEYSPRIQSAPVFKSEMTQGRKGINLIGKGTLALDNTDGYFDNIYDTLIFENKKVDVYSYNRDLASTEALAIFRGTITAKSFSSSKVNFSLTDDLYALDSEISGTQFGDLVVDNPNNYMRKVFGQVDNMRVQSIDQSKKTRTLTGTLKLERDSKYVRGNGTSFLSQLSIGDSIQVGEDTYDVNRILTDEYLEMSDASYFDSTSYIGNYTSETPSPIYNRIFHVTDHAIKEWSTTISSITARNRVVVTSIVGFKAGDIVVVDGNERKTIKRISGNTFVFTTSLNLTYGPGSIITRDVISKIAYSETGREITKTDTTINNDVNGCTFTLSQDAEINATPVQTLNSFASFVQGYRKIWLGAPCLLDITCLAHSSTSSLFNKYFTLKEEDGGLLVFYFADDLPVGATATIPPNISSNEYPIVLENRPYTASEVAIEVLYTVIRNTDIYEGHIDISNEAKIHFYSKEPITLSSGSAGTSGFTYTFLQAGTPVSTRIDLSKLVQNRDYVQSSEDATTEFYEVLDASQTHITLREPYGGDTGRAFLRYKVVQYIGDDTPVFVNCLGMTKNGLPTGEPILTAPDAVNWILDNRGLGSYIDSTSFFKSSQEAPELLSFTLPYNFGDDKMPKASDAINKLNQTVIGSLFINEQLKLGYNILDASRDVSTLQTIGDDDVISWSLKADAFDISKEVIASYRFQDYSIQKKEKSNLEVKYNSSFVDKYVGNNKIRRTSLYLFDTSEAQAQVERDELFTSLSNDVIQVKGSLNLSKYKLGERVVLKFSRLHKVLGTEGSLQIGVITSVNNTGEKVDLEIESLGALYSRAGIISKDDGIDDFASATNEDLTVTSFVLNDDEIIGTNESTFNTSLIS